MNDTVFMNIIALVTYVASMVLILFIKEERLKRTPRLFIFLCPVVAIYVSVSNIFEHGGISPILDFYEDYFEIIYIPIFVFFVYSFVSLREIDARKKKEKRIATSLKEREVLIREIHHRVKNNFQVISGLISLQSSKSDNEDIHEYFNTLINRINSLSLVHEILYGGNDLSVIHSTPYITSLLDALCRAYLQSGKNIAIDHSLSDIELGLDTAMPLGIIINELVSNSFKHAFSNQADGKIEISLQSTDKNIILRVSDNGKGVDMNFNSHHAKTLGITLVQSLTKQLRGDLHMESVNGTSVTVSIPISKKR